MDARPEAWLGISVMGNNSRSISAHGKWIVIIILLVSLVLRWILILRGGQYYNSDETRYEVSRAAARFLSQGQLGEALEQYTISPEHLGFEVIGILPALMEQVTGPSLAMPAVFFSLFSVFNLHLIFLLSQVTSGSSAEPFYALALAAACQSLLYYSRHLIPYDVSLSFGLWALYIPVVRDQTAKTSFLCGGLSFLCFITYNGYWPLAVFAMLAYILMNGKEVSSSLQKAIVTGLGFMTPLVLLIIVMQRSGKDMISAYQLFATSITQGSFQEGWSIPFEYFWHTEYAVILIIGAFSSIAIIDHFMNPRSGTKVWVAGILFIYICLVVSSVVLHYFVVYARLARQLIPFLVLLSAQGFIHLENRADYGRKVTLLIFVVIFIQAAWNYSAAYQIGFPRDFSTEAQVRFPGFEFSSKRLAYGAPVICQYNGYMIENAKFYVAPPERIPQVKGQLLLSVPHPTNYLPYLYEGDPPDFRQTYRTLKLSMSFYKTDQEFMSETNPEWTAIETCIVPEK